MVSTRQGTHTFEAKMVRYKEKARWKHHAKKVVPYSTTNVHGVQMQGSFFNHKFLLEIINQPLITPLLQLIVSLPLVLTKGVMHDVDIDSPVVHQEARVSENVNSAENIVVVCDKKLC